MPPSNGCFLNQHDPVLVALAALVCVVTAFTVIDLFHHARVGLGRLRGTWLAVAGLAGGIGIWATHFVAMMAYDGALPSGYGPALTFVSLVPAGGFTFLGLGLALALPPRVAGWAGGTVVGLGIVVMHHLGLAAYETTAHVTWDPFLSMVSIALGVFLSAASLALASSRSDTLARAVAVGLLVTATCAMHFTSMAAVGITYDPLVTLSDGALTQRWIAYLAGGAGLFVVSLAGGAVALDTRERFRRCQSDLAISLANASADGILLTDGEVVLAANESFASIFGIPASEIAGKRLPDVLPSLPGLGTPGHETEMTNGSGERIPVEVIRNGFVSEGKRRQAIAVRDLRPRIAAERRMLHMAHHDTLTGLPNRARFASKLDAEMAAATPSRPVAVMLLDLDRFKEVNDTFGHAAGDDLLIAVGRGISAILGPDQMLARLGGDEFAVVLPGVADAGEAAGWAALIIEAVRAAASGLPAGGAIGTSVGSAIYPGDANDRRALLTNADLALYEAKAAGRGVHRPYDGAMGEEAQERRVAERDLRLALERDEFRLVYQPQRDTSTGTLAGVEALIRWDHPTRGEILPSGFLQMAEESGLIHAIGEWALRRACLETLPTAGLRVAVNVSVSQVHSGRFAGMVAGVLRETGMPPERVELEVTESALIQDPERTLATLTQLKQLGVNVTMDDFGTGYSALSDLATFPFDKIKIDRSFVRAVDSEGPGTAIVRALLGRGLGLPVVAEGVETEGELSFLEAEACDEVQGYLLGRPGPGHFSGLAGIAHAANLLPLASMPKSQKVA